MNDFGSHIVIKNSEFNNINSCGSLIRNKWYQWSDITLAKNSFTTLYKYRVNNF